MRSKGLRNKRDFKKELLIKKISHSETKNNAKQGSKIKEYSKKGFRYKKDLKRVPKQKQAPKKGF